MCSLPTETQFDPTIFNVAIAMKPLRTVLYFLLGLLLCWGLATFWPQVPSIAATGDSDKDFESLIENTQVEAGLFTLYRNPEEGKYYLEVRPDQLNQNYLCIPSLAQGIGDYGLINGLSLYSFLFQFRKVNDTLQFVIPNIHFRTQPNDPLRDNLNRSFSDSVLYSLPIKSTHPERQSFLIELNGLLINDNDLSGIVQMLSEYYSLDKGKSYFSKGKAFPSNLEVEVVYGLSSRSGSAPLYLPSVPDPRSFNLGIHYSFAQLPQDNRYVPRLADDRIGYFITAYKNLSDIETPDGFVRYLERWQLEPENPNLDLSPPKKPIVFWVDKTTPYEYRDAVKEGVLMWNEAFEKIGFKDAIQVKQMPDDADWDPEDIRYNTIRWSSTSNSGVAGVGPSHVNPLTGEIIAADIVINGEVLRRRVDDYETFLGLNEYSLGCEKTALAETPETQNPFFSPEQLANQDICFGVGLQEEFSLGLLSMDLFQTGLPSVEERETFVRQYLHQLVAHEVGHTLGLRHNFHGSTLLEIDELHNTEKTHDQGLVSSVMDYVTVNIAPPGVEQGDYFPTKIGPYDQWAIAYGYKPSGALIPVAERRMLEEIAQKSPQPELAYATDEDYYGFHDPYVNAWDLSGDILQWSENQMNIALQMWEQLQKRYPVRGDKYSEVRARFHEVLHYYYRQARFVSNFIGGRSFNRDRPGTPNSRPPFEKISVEKQRQALKLLQDYVFTDEPFDFPPEFLNQLAPSRWHHWGNWARTTSLDYPLHDYIVGMQGNILRSLLANWRLSLLRDMELKADSENVLTLPELYNTLTESIWSEVLNPEYSQNISTLRRSLQREYLEILSRMVLGEVRVPQDAQTLAWYQLRELNEAVDQTLNRFGEGLDTYTTAHLAESRDRITKTLDARYQRQ